MEQPNAERDKSEKLMLAEKVIENILNSTNTFPDGREMSYYRHRLQKQDIDLNAMRNFLRKCGYERIELKVDVSSRRIDK